MNIVPAQSDKLTQRLSEGRHPGSMVDRPAGLVRLFFRSMLQSVDFAKRVVDSMREAEEKGTVVYVMRTRSIIDYLYFNFAFLEHGLKLVRFANGVKTHTFRGFFGSIGSRLRGRRGLPSDVECLDAAVAADLPSMIFLRRPRRKELQEISFSLPYLLKLVEKQRQTATVITLIPTLLVWDKRPEKQSPNVLDDVFGSRHSPTTIKKLWMVVSNFWESFLQLGRPSVQTSTQVSLREFIDERPGVTDEKIAQELRAYLLDALNREETVVVGPWVKTAEEMRREILADERVRKRLEEANINLADFSTAKNANKIIEEISADFTPIAIKAMSALLHPVWNIMYDGIEVDQEGIKRVREAARTKRLVIVPSHKSHIDYLVISYIFYHNGLIPPHIAAGVNLSFWPLGPLFRHSGAFFLRRTFSDDYLYATLFRAYMIKLIEEGFPIEFFIEGTRSRTGKLAPPKYGMLDMIVEAFRGGNVTDLAIVPVSVGYEKVVESSSYRKELEGKEKKSESLAGLLESTSVLASRYGRIHVEFGDLIDLGAYLETYHEDINNIEREDLNQTVRRLAYRIIHGINSVTTVTPSAIVALAALNANGNSIDAEQLVKEAGFIIGYLQEDDVRMSRALTEPIQARLATIPPVHDTEASPSLEAFDAFDRAFLENDANTLPVTTESRDVALGKAVSASLSDAIALLQKNGLVSTEVVDGRTLIQVPQDHRVELAFYKNNILHYFADEAVFATALVAAADENGKVDAEQAKEHARYLSQLLKYEFCFNDRRFFDGIFENTADSFIQYGWISEPQPGVFDIGARPAAGLEYIRGLLLTILEGYWLAASSLEKIADWTDQKSLAKRAVAQGRTMHQNGDLRWPESRALSTLDSAFRLLKDWGAFEQRKEEKGKRSRDVRVSIDWQDGKMHETITRLRSYLRPQRRSDSEELYRRPRKTPPPNEIAVTTANSRNLDQARETAE